MALSEDKIYTLDWNILSHLSLSIKLQKKLNYFNLYLLICLFRIIVYLDVIS